MATVSDSYPTRRILEGVPRVWFGEGRYCPFPGSLYAYLQYVGDPYEYDYLMGVTGAAFRRLWNRDDGGNVDLSYFGDEPFRRVFEALGYSWRKVPAEKEPMMRAIREAISLGRPAISFGIIGPPEAGLVAGYDRGGEVLYGWSYFQEGQGAYYESADWFETMDRHAGKGLIVIGDKLASRPSPRDVLVASLEWAVALARTVRWPHLPEHVGGLAAYDTWADGLGVDADYPPDSEEVLATRVMVHADQCTMLDERRNAAGYLRQTADVAPEVAEHLRTAATLFDAAADHVGPAWPWSYSMGRDAQLGLSDAGTRQEVAGHVRAAGALEAQAVEVLERALAKLR